MKKCSPRVYETGSTQIEILTFLMEEGEDFEDFIQTIKNMYPGQEIRIPAMRTAEIVFLKKIELEPIRKSDLDYWNEETPKGAKKKK